MNRIAWLVFSLRLLIPSLLLVAPAACTRDYALGAVDARGPDATETVTDAPVETTIDSPIEPDAPTEIQCVENGISYHVGDVIPRGTADCSASCVCLDGGVVGHCTGACPHDASPTDTPPGPQVARIVVKNASGLFEVDVNVYADGRAVRQVTGSVGVQIPSVVYEAESPDVLKFLADLAGVGDISGVGDPNSIYLVRCGNSASFGTQTKVTAGAVTSGDLECLLTAEPTAIALAHDCSRLAGTYPAALQTMEQRCLQTNGTVSVALCCAEPGFSDFPDTCAVGACGCSPQQSEVINTCACPAGACFLPDLGCVGPAGVCTVAADQTCNDNIQLNSVHGRCVTGGRCVCGSLGFAASGKCL